MKKLVFLCLVLFLSAKVSYCLDPLRVSVTTTPNLTANLTIDLLKDDGTLLSNVYSESSKPSGTSGIISVILQGGSWATSGYSKDYLVRITYGTTVLSIERLEVAIEKQSLYGATISSDDIDQTANYSLNSLTVNGTTTLKKTVGNVIPINMTGDAYSIDLSSNDNSTLIFNIVGTPNNSYDIITITNPTDGQILIFNYFNSGTNAGDKLKFNFSNSSISSKTLFFLCYINPSWYYNSFTKFP
jgi:hypothetical protein